MLRLACGARMPRTLINVKLVETLWSVHDRDTHSALFVFVVVHKLFWKILLILVRTVL